MINIGPGSLIAIRASRFVVVQQAIGVEEITLILEKAIKSTRWLIHQAPVIKAAA